MASRDISFLAFFLIWAKVKRWKVPEIHVRAIDWLEHRGDLAVLRAFRGFAKSSILEVYNAWRYYRNATYRILHQSESNGTAYKTSRGTQNVLRAHPLTRGMFRDGGVEQWWVEGSDDPRNASMYAMGIMSNVTSARCDEAQNDDVEVPKNIQSPEAREKLRFRLGEQTHILVPGGRQLFVGTPHTHDSIYDEMERLGADCLTIRMFEEAHRIEDAKERVYDLPFIPVFVFSGIGREARLLAEGADYKLAGSSVVFSKPVGGLVDCYGASSWPERFDRAELLKRRRKTRTINEWDSQYQLHSKPVHEIRLDPERLIPYDAEPKIVIANGGVAMWLGNARIASAAVRWDPASGDLHNDVSALCVILQDDGGRRYWHRAQRLQGEVAEFSADGKTITGGQVFQLCQLVRELHLPRVTVETNGIGKFAPSSLRACMKQQRLVCGVAEHTSVGNKNKRILEAIEPLIKSRGQLWAHVSVLDGPLWDEMKDWNPAIVQQPDNYLDAGAGAIEETPERIGRVVGLNAPAGTAQDWRPDAGVHEVEVEGY